MFHFTEFRGTLSGKLAVVLATLLLLPSLALSFGGSQDLPDQRSPSNKTHLCKYQGGDIGTVIGRGPTASSAFEDAATQCFDRHQALVKKFRGEQEAERRGILHIDICANISCR